MTDLLFDIVNPMAKPANLEQRIKSESKEIYETTIIDETSKCGEIFALFGGDFILICGFCHDIHENMLTFGLHVKEQHNEKFEGIVSYLKAKKPSEVVPTNEDIKAATCSLDTPSEPRESLCEEEDVEIQTDIAKPAKYVCENCGQSYKQKGRLRNHQLKTNCKRMSPRRVEPIETICVSGSTPYPIPDNIEECNEAEAFLEVKDEHVETANTTLQTSLPDNNDHEADIVKNEFVETHEDWSQELYFSDNAVDSQDESPEKDTSTRDNTPTKLKKGTSPKEFPCDSCEKVFRSKQARTYHTNRHHNSTQLSTENITQSQQSPRCKYCNQEFSSKQECTEHEATHIGEKRFLCLYCTHTFRTNYGRKRHMRVHTGERPFKCTECPKAFPHMVQLDYHIRKHKDLREFCCQICGKAFIRKFELSLHERKHTGFRPLVCEDCGKTFNVMSELNEHRKRHTDRKDWKCLECGKCFYSKWTLKDHMAGHSDETPFGCDVCGKKFSRPKALKKHKKLHSDVKSYVCNICGKAYAQDSGLYAHKKTHGIRNSNTPSTNKNG